MKMQFFLEAACDSGQLDVALSSLGDQIAPREDLEEIRVRLKGLMETACESGDLEKTMSMMRSTGNGLPIDDGRANVIPSDLQGMRSRLKNLLEASCESGQLEQAFCDVKDASTLAANPISAYNSDLDNVRNNVKNILEVACVSGDLARELDLMRSSETAIEPSDSTRKNLMKDFAAASSNEIQMA